jgi:hypothetical protein
MRGATKKKYKAIQDRFKVLYDVDRLRIDDCQKQLSEEFFISIPTLERILTKNLNE